METSSCPTSSTKRKHSSQLPNGWAYFDCCCRSKIRRNREVLDLQCVKVPTAKVPIRFGVRSDRGSGRPAPSAAQRSQIDGGRMGSRRQMCHGLTHMIPPHHRGPHQTTQKSTGNEDAGVSQGQGVRPRRAGSKQPHHNGSIAKRGVFERDCLVSQGFRRETSTHDEAVPRFDVSTCHHKPPQICHRAARR